MMNILFFALILNIRMILTLYEIKRFLQNGNNTSLDNLINSSSELKKIGYLTLPIKIGTPPQDMELIIDTSINSSELFLSHYNYSVSTTHRSVGSTHYDNLTILSIEIPQLEFNIIENSNLNGRIGGKLGLGYYNSFFSSINSNSKKKMKEIFEINMSEREIILGGLSKPNSEYSFSNVSDTNDLDEKYAQGWVTDFSHLMFGNSQYLNESLPINGKAVFNSTANYIYAPKDYLNVFLTEYFLNKFLSKCVRNSDKNDVGFICPKMEITNNYQNIDKISLIFEGYAYTLKSEYLFLDYDNENFEFVIKFRPENDNIWTIGVPFFNIFTIAFDNEDNRIAINGQEKRNFTNDWMNWKRDSLNLLTTKHEYGIVIIGAFFGSVVLLIIILYIIHSIKRNRLQQHGPLIESH